MTKTAKKQNGTDQLGGRAQQVLKILVERFIEQGLPVGSRTLAKEVYLDLSPATIRNVMSDLEGFGLVRAPHTSAGRVPTVPGYRMFVNSLLTIRPLANQEIRSMADRLEDQQDPQALLESVSSLLSSITHMAGVVTVPRQENTLFRHVEYLPLSDQRVLVILVLNQEEVQNRIIRTRRQYSASELEQAANYLNSNFAGMDLASMKGHLLGELQQTRERMNRMMLAVIEMAQQALNTEEKDSDFLMSGQTNLMEFADLANMDRLRQLFEAFSEKQGIMHLLEQCIHAEGVQIFIGNESGYHALDDCSVVSAPYSLDGKQVGVLGVIGPTRMAYERVIPLVDVTAKLLSSALKRL